jgi:hypothetical protein
VTKVDETITEAADPAGNKPVVNTDDLPVVARMVIEIRSDGTRTVARAAYEDGLTGERVSTETSGGAPGELAAQLMRSIRDLPVFQPRAMAKAFVSGAVARLKGLGWGKDE